MFSGLNWKNVVKNIGFSNIESLITFLGELRALRTVSQHFQSSQQKIFKNIEAWVKKTVTIFCEWFYGVNWKYVVKNIGFSNIESSSIFIRELRALCTVSRQFQSPQQKKIKHELKKVITIFCEGFSRVNWKNVVKNRFFQISSPQLFLYEIRALCTVSRQFQSPQQKI